MGVGDYEVAIIGSGPGGYRAALLCAQRGLKVALVEAGTWGGTCLNRGCVPKKAWHHSAQFVARSRGFPQRGLASAGAADLESAWQHQRGVVAGVRAGYLDMLARLGVARVSARARFTGPRTLAVDPGGELKAAHVIVASGSRPAFPAALPLTPGRIISTDELFDAPPPPGRRVAVAGSGVIGTEFAFILSQLGCTVTWICRAAPITRARFSPAARRLLMDEFSRAGVTPRLGARVARAAIRDREVALTLDDGETLAVDWVLAAAGRRPCSAGLGLEEIGIVPDAEGFIPVDAQQRTALPHVFAIGDVASREMSANQALAQAAIAVDALCGRRARHDALAVPFVLYSATVLARLGLTEDEAEENGIETAVGFAAFESNPRARGQDDASGFVRLVADADDARLIGAEIAGGEADELIHLPALAYDTPGGLRRLAALRYNHPARAEEVLNAVESLASKWGLGERILHGE